MSKAFTSEETPDEPVIVRPRAPLPEGVPNYVTPNGLQRLRAELIELESERARIASAITDEQERRRQLSVSAERIGELAQRIGCAIVVDPANQSHDVIRFGARVDLRNLDDTHEGEERRFQIVGVDEADPSVGKIAFVSPLARAILGREVGDTVSLQTGRGDEELEITGIDYAAGDEF